MARTGMDIDTISSVNSLSSPYDIYPGMELLIPNMRGIYDLEEKENSSSVQKKTFQEIQSRSEVHLFR